MNKTRLEPILVEFFKNNHWIGVKEEKYVAQYRKDALRELGKIPDRYWYPPWLGGKVRVSYYEGKM